MTDEEPEEKPKEKVRIVSRRDSERTLLDGTKRTYVITTYSTETASGRVAIDKEDYTPELEAEEIRKDLDLKREEFVGEEIEV